jgi:hypothetical protein
MVDDHESKKSQIIQLIKNAASKADSPPTDRLRAAVISFLLFIICLLGTTIPHANLNTFFSIAAIISGLVWFHLWWRSGRRLKFSGWKTAALAAALVSQVAGCAGLMMNGQSLNLIAFGIQSDKIKVGEVQGSGSPVSPSRTSPPKAAMQNGTSKKPSAPRSS